MGDPPGDASLYPEPCPPAIITADCIKWSLSHLLDAQAFFVNALNSQVIREQIVAITKGVAQQKISLAGFRTIPIPLAPLNEQQGIVAEVERRLSVIEELESVVEANLKRAERLRQSILKRAFEGKLVAQDPSDEPASVLLERIRAERASRTKHAGEVRGPAARSDKVSRINHEKLNEEMEQCSFQWDS